jgi:hypothetical protein
MISYFENLSILLTSMILFSIIIEEKRREIVVTRRYISGDSVPNAFVGRRGSKVEKRRLKLWQWMFPLIVILAILGSCSIIALRANGQCCPSTPEPVIREVEKTVFVPVPVFAELPCANHRFEIGSQMFGPEPMSLAVNLDWRPNLCRLGWLNFDGALGLSGATIGGEAMIGFNAKLGLAFTNPGPYFDIVEMFWFPKWDSYYYEGVGLRIPVFYPPIGREMSVLLYLGGEMFVCYSSVGYTKSDTLLFGGAARICRHDFSLGFQAELKAVHQVRDCKEGWSPGFGVKISLWF